MQNFLINNQWVVWPLLAWALAWKGWALWIAARRGEKAWYVALLIVNTMGLLEIIYILLARRTKKGVAAS